MISRVTCLLDGVSLESLDERLAVVDVYEHPARERRATALAPLRCGTRVYGSFRESLSVTVTFVARERRMPRRALLLEEAAKWCRGTRMTLSSRPGRVLKVRCVSLPCPGSALGWNEPLTATFEADEIPFWQDERPSVLRLGPGKTLTGTLFVPGSAPDTVVCARIQNKDAAVCQQLLIRAGETAMGFSGLALQKDETLVVDYDAHDTLSLAVEDILGARRSVFQCRNEESEDDLLLPCGEKSEVLVNASVNLTAEISARGRYL